MKEHLVPAVVFPAWIYGDGGLEDGGTKHHFILLSRRIPILAQCPTGNHHCGKMVENQYSLQLPCQLTRLVPWMQAEIPLASKRKGRERGKKKRVKGLSRSSCSSSTTPIWGIIVGLLLMGSLRGEVWAANKIEGTEQRGVTPSWEHFKKLICNSREQLITPLLLGKQQIRFNL